MLCVQYWWWWRCKCKFGLKATDVNITVNRSIFKDNYSASCGGGLIVSNYNSTQENQVTLMHTKFINNSVPYQNTGGGLQLFLGFSNRSSVSLISCQFTKNSAHSGGGVNIYLHEGYDYKSFEFINCLWSENTALYGAAFHAMPSFNISKNQNHNSMIVFSNCTISHNKVTSTIDIHHGNFMTQTNGAGAVFSNQISLSFSGRTTFKNNTGTALYLTESTASFHSSSTVLFSNNYGTNGGGVSLLGRSYLYLLGASDFSFVKNTARWLGGGIYFHAADDILYQPCFIYNGAGSSSNARFTFSDNHVHKGGRGQHIFASSYASCTVGCSRYDIYDCIGNFSFSKPHSNSTATLPTNFNLKTNQSGPLSFFPGLSAKLPLLVTDHEGNKVSNLSYQATLLHTNASVYIDPAFRYVSANIIALQGNERQIATLRLDTMSGDTSILIDVTLMDCPPGYIHNNSRCVCNAAKYYGVVKCNPEAYVRHGIWMGKCKSSNTTSFCTSDCPVGHCSHNKKLYKELPMNQSDPGSILCFANRHGTVCGQCKANHSVYFNSWSFSCFEDKQCHLGFLYLFLSTLLPLAILFMMITLLDMNFAGGWNGFIVFSQVVNTFYLYGNGAINFPSIQFHVLNWLMFIYSFFNLEIFNIDQMSFCIWKGANVMDILMVKLGSICFSLALVLVTVYVLKQRKLSKYFPCLVRRRYTVINGISAFLILCYAQCAKTCLQVLDTSCIYDENHVCFKNVLFLMGDMELFKGAHFKYALVAIVFILVIVLLPPALLIFYPLFFRVLGICKLSETRIAIYLWRKIPIQLLDSFQNPFKDEYRFFAGLFFLYRAIPLAIYAVTKDLVQYFTLVELNLGLMIVLHSTFQPYKNRLHNITDILLFFNLAVIKGITLYNYLTSTSSDSGVESNVSFLSSIQIVLLLLPIIAVGSIIINKTATHIKQKRNRDRYNTIEAFSE